MIENTQKISKPNYRHKEGLKHKKNLNELKKRTLKRSVFSIVIEPVGGCSTKYTSRGQSDGRPTITLRATEPFAIWPVGPTKSYL